MKIQIQHRQLICSEIVFLIRVIGTRNNLHSGKLSTNQSQVRQLINQSGTTRVALLHQYELYQAYRVSRAKTNEGTLRLDIDIYFRTFDTQWSSEMSEPLDCSRLLFSAYCSHTIPDTWFWITFYLTQYAWKERIKESFRQIYDLVAFVCVRGLAHFKYQAGQRMGRASPVLSIW